MQESRTEVNSVEICWKRVRQHRWQVFCCVWEKQHETTQVLCAIVSAAGHQKNKDCNGRSAEEHTFAVDSFVLPWKYLLSVSCQKAKYVLL